MKMHVSTQVIEILARSGTPQSTQEVFTEQDSLECLHLDSLALLEVFFELEKEFDIEIDPSCLDGLTTVGDLVRLVTSTQDLSDKH